MTTNGQTKTDARNAIEKAAIRAAPSDLHHYRHPDGRLMIKHKNRIYSFRTTDGAAEPRDGLIDDPREDGLRGIPIPVLQHVRDLGYQFGNSGIGSDIIDAEKSDQNHELQV